MDVFDTMAEYAYSQSLEKLTKENYCVALILFAAVLLFGMLIGRRIRGWNGRKTVSLAVLLPYLYLTFMFAVFGREERASSLYELMPFWSYYEAFAHGRKILLLACLLNVVMFAPLGICLAGLDVRFRYAIVVGVCLSYSIEVSQLLLHKGLFELFDDPFHNVLGTILGYCLFAGVHKLFTRALTPWHGET